MATASVTQLAEIKREDGMDIGLSGLLGILVRRTSRGGPNFNSLGMLTDKELVSVTNQAGNIATAALEGLSTVGTLIASFDSTRTEFDHNAVGWLTEHLSGTVREMREMEGNANRELARRGYDPLGFPLRQKARA